MDRFGFILFNSPYDIYNPNINYSGDKMENSKLKRKIFFLLVPCYMRRKEGKRK